MTHNKTAYRFRWLPLCCLLFIAAACSDITKNYADKESPTSGKLKVCYDEGLALHVKNQAATFESQYKNATIHLFQTSESEAVQALYTDSCEAIVISRLLTDTEKKAFEAKTYYPKYSAVAKSGVALITSVRTPLDLLSYENVIKALTEPYIIKDSLGKEHTLKILFDKNNSSVLHYMLDSILKGKPLSSHCNILSSTVESINYAAANPNTIALIDFAWLSDADDSLSRANKNKIKFLKVSKAGTDTFELPSQSSFKLNTYPFTRTVYVFRKTSDYTLAKGFESFVAGPKGQLTFLKQGLLPTRQPERGLKINMEEQSDKNQ